MKTKMGRPTLPKGEAKGAQFGVRYNPAAVEKIQRVIEKSGTKKTMAEWIRDETITNAEQWERPHLASDVFWGELPFSREEMDRKTIKFKTLIKWPEHEKPSITSGTGTMYIRERPDGFHVRIISLISPKQEKVIDLSKKQASLIRREPAGSDCEFSLESARP
jgi:hypothetical protein